MEENVSNTATPSAITNTRLDQVAASFHQSESLDHPLMGLVRPGPVAARGVGGRVVSAAGAGPAAGLFFPPLRRLVERFGEDSEDTDMSEGEASVGSGVGDGATSTGFVD